MAYQFLRLPYDVQAANVKTLGLALNAFFAGLGFVQTADTGQVNWSTFNTTPVTSGTIVAYEIWRFNDVLQSANPLFFRVDYTAVSVPNNEIAVNFTFGQGSSGTGTIQPALALLSIGASNSPAQTSGLLYECYFNGGPGWFSLMMWRDGLASQGFILAVERSHDRLGNDTGDYWTVVCSGGNAVSQQTMFKPGMPGSGTQDSGYWNVLLPHGTSSSVWGNNVGVSPVYPWIGKPDNPMLALMVASSGDVGEMQQGRVNIYGNDHMYLFTKQSNMTKALRNAPSSCCVGIRMD